MKFKLVEKFDETRDMVQDYMYDAMDELNNASLEEYIQWFKSELTYYDDEVERAVTDAYIEACDYGMIKGVEKTRLTSELKEYIESNTDIIDDTDELMRQCPGHLQHELKIVLSKLDESLTESVLEEAIRPDLKRFIEQHAELLDENNIEELYKQCPRELKIPLVRMLNAASLGDNIESIKRATYLADFYDDDELINLVLSVGEHANDVFDAFDYIMNNWDEFFTDDMLNEELLTEDSFNDFSQNHKFIYEARFKTKTGELELFTDDFNKFSNMIYKYYLNNSESPIIIHVLELTLDCENNFNFPDSDFVFIDDDNQLKVQKISYQIHSHKELNKVVHNRYRRTSEQNKLSDDTLSKENRLLYFWSKHHNTKQQIQELNKDFLYIEFS